MKLTPRALQYLWKVSYTKTGVRGVAQEGGTSRRDAVKRAVESVGGTLDAVYFAFGETDVYVIADLPDNQSAAASLARREQYRRIGHPDRRPDAGRRTGCCSEKGGQLPASRKLIADLNSLPGVTNAGAGAGFP